MDEVVRPAHSLDSVCVLVLRVYTCERRLVHSPLLLLERLPVNLTWSVANSQLVCRRIISTRAISLTPVLFAIACFGRCHLGCLAIIKPNSV